MKKRHTGVWVFLILFVLAAAGAGGYYTYAQQYEDRFLEGTFINGDNVGNMTAAEVEEAIRTKVEDYELKLTFADDQTETLSMEEIGFAYVPDGKAESILAEQNPYEWIRGKLGQTAEYTVSEAYTYDENKLRDAILSLPEMRPENQVAPSDAHMQMGEDKRLRIVPEIDGNQIDANRVIEAAKEAVSTGIREVDVTALDAYSSAGVRADDPELVLAVSDLNAYLDTEITYTLYDGSKMKLGRDDIATFLSVRDDDPDAYYFNTETAREKCTEFIRKMAEQYDYTYDTVTFHTTYEGDLTIPCETSGRLIDEESESAALYEAVLEKVSVEKEPAYSLFRDADGQFGGTYVEVDIDAQHMWYYHDGEIRVESDCVTGKASDPNRATPRGVYYIYTKERNRTLKGEINPSTGKPSYESFVNYWMPFNEGIGLHDASWRSSFGGSIYYENGSHGCVNLPYSVAQALYDVLEVGTPVIVD